MSLKTNHQQKQRKGQSVNQSLDPWIGRSIRGSVARSILKKEQLGVVCSTLGDEFPSLCTVVFVSWICQAFAEVV